MKTADIAPSDGMSSAPSLSFGSAEGRSYWTSAAFVALLSFALSLTAQYFHEFWRDEAHTVLLVESAKNLQALRAGQQNTLHPIGYYLIEWIAYLIGGLPLMKILNAAAVAMGCAAIMLSRGLSTTTRWLIPFSFFPLFQYGAFLRSYSLLFCLICCYALLNEQKRSPLFRLVVLGLIGQIHLYGLIFAFVLIIIEEWRSFAPQNFSPFSALPVLALFISGWSILPSRQGNNYDPGGLDRIFYITGQGIFPSLLPLATFNEIQSLAIGIGGALYFLIGYIACRHGGLRLAAILIGTSAPVLIQSVLFSYGNRWHASFLWVVLIYAIWIFRIEAKSRFIRLFLPSILFVQVVSGISAFSRDLFEPYSSSQEVAKFLQSQSAMPKILIGVHSSPNSLGWYNDSAQSVAAYLPGWKMGNPLTGEEDSLFFAYLETVAWRDCATAVKELTVFLKSRGLSSVALISASGDELECFPSSKEFEIQGTFVGPGGFDYGEKLSAYIVSLSSSR